jgi:hypothetical protein
MKRLVTFTRIVLLIVAASTWAFAETDTIKVMTRNEYLGADIAPVLQAQTPSAFIAWTSQYRSISTAIRYRKLSGSSIATSFWSEQA